jgi:hypothetical protein
MHLLAYKDKMGDIFCPTRRRTPYTTHAPYYDPGLEHRPLKRTETEIVFYPLSTKKLHIEPEPLEKVTKHKIISKELSAFDLLSFLEKISVEFNTNLYHLIIDRVILIFTL